MKTDEEIKAMAESLFGKYDEISLESRCHFSGFIKGYKSCFESRIQTQQPVESDAVEFSEWLRSECDISDAMDCLYVYNKIHYDSIEPLYAEFKNRKK